jgi:hypothetical protein
MKKIMMVAAATAVVAVLVPLTAEAAPSLPAGMQEVQGHGLGACPAEHLCLYKNEDFNGSSDDTIWTFNGIDHGALGQSIDLRGTPAANSGRSAYLNSDRAEAVLHSAYAEAVYRSNDEFIRFQLHKKLPSLNGANGYYGPAKTSASVNLNDRAGSVYINNAPTLGLVSDGFYFLPQGD